MPPSDPEEELYLRALYEEPYRTPKWLINRAKSDKRYSYYDDSQFFFVPVKGGCQVVSKDNAPILLDTEIRTTEDGKQYLWWGPKEQLWQDLKKLNLKDPVIIAKIRKAYCTFQLSLTVLVILFSWCEVSHARLRFEN